jgi:hypothetical protein
MRTALRTVAAFALAVPLLAPALPTAAPDIVHYRDKGTFADAFFEGEGTPGGLPGTYSMAWLTFHSSDLAEGWVDTFDCEEGQTPWGDEEGENVCDWNGTYYAWGEGLTVVSGKGKKDSSYSGTVDLYDATGEEGGDLVVAGVPFDLTLSPTRAMSRSTYSDTFRDPEAGVTFRFREMRATKYATAQGDLDGVPAVEGSVGTYSLRGMERIR